MKLSDCYRDAVFCAISEIEQFKAEIAELKEQLTRAEKALEEAGVEPWGKPATEQLKEVS